MLSIHFIFWKRTWKCHFEAKQTGIWTNNGISCYINQRFLQACELHVLPIKEIWHRTNDRVIIKGVAKRFFLDKNLAISKQLGLELVQHTCTNFIWMVVYAIFSCVCVDFLALRPSRKKDANHSVLLGLAWLKIETVPQFPVPRTLLQKPTLANKTWFPKKKLYLKKSNREKHCNSGFFLVFRLNAFFSDVHQCTATVDSEG